MKKINELMPKLMELEEKGRELAYDLDSQPSREDEKFTSGIIFYLGIVKDALPKTIPSRWEEEEAVKELKNIDELASAVKDAAFSLSMDIYYCQEKGATRKGCEVSEQTYEKIDNIDEVYGKISGGKRCSWMKGVKHPYNLASALNDLTACYHRLVEMIGRVSRAVSDISKKCFSFKGSRRAEEFCILWDKLTSQARPAYEYVDYKELEGMVFGDKLYLRVGSSLGHAMEIDFGKDELVYYDVDDAILNVFYSVLTDKGAECLMEPENYVLCRRLSNIEDQDLAKVIAWVTSADIRANSLCVETIEKQYAECREKCYSSCKDIEDPVERRECIVTCLNECYSKSYSGSCGKPDILTDYAMKDFEEFCKKFF